MKHVITFHIFKRGLGLLFAVGILAVLTGCDEVNLAIDSALGRQSPVLSASNRKSSLWLVPAKKRDPGEKAPGPEDGPDAPGQPLAQPAPKGSPLQKMVAQGKKRTPGALAPTAEQALLEEARPKEEFIMQRDPFEQPTEILPTECPPSMPLCRFDRSQLKLVGVLQLSEGQFKGMVEDPDGRGYFVNTGMQIGGATVTQVTNKGIILHVHKTRQDVLMPLFKEAREGGPKE